MTKINLKSQNGRSMVEMLGVLSIIGVLSVGGISAYTTAMEKHKANELLHQASMLATTISAQAMTNDGNLPQTITSFGNSSYGNFSTSVTNALDGKGFSITIENVDSGVCTQMENMAGGMMRSVECSEPDADNKVTATLTYYKNLATNDEEGANSPTGEKPDPACADVKCDDGLSCVNGSCLCPDGTLPCNGLCCEKGQVCSAPVNSKYAECATPTGGECATNADCDPGEFCLFGSYTSSSVSGTTCPVPGNGVCTALTGSYAEKMVEDSDEPLYGMTYSDTLMNLGSASNWCQANGGRLITWATLNTLSGEDSDDARKKALRGGLGKTSGYVWLGDASSSTPCDARGVYFGSLNKPSPPPYDESLNEAALFVLCE